MMTAGKFANTYEFKGEERGKLVCLSNNDLIELMEEYAKYYHQSKVNNGVLGDVIIELCVCKSKTNTYIDSYKDKIFCKDCCKPKA